MNSTSYQDRQRNREFEAVIARFESAWRKESPPSIEPWLAGAGDERRAWLVELAHVDLELSIKAGLRRRVEDYLDQFPELAPDHEALQTLIQGEYELRSRVEGSVEPEEYARRFPQLRVALASQFGASAAAASQSDASTFASSTATVVPRDARPVRLNVPFASTDFELVREIGHGGMGIVYEALERRRGQHVALKTLPRFDVGLLTRFKNEFRSLADLSHPNLVTLYELIADGDQWFFSMELVDGREFCSYARAQPEQLLPALRQLVAGLNYLHRSRRAHRDIKPRNVLVTNQGRVVILDFGLVTQLDASGAHQTMVPLGTPAYMSPEQAAVQPVSAATDWYALGVMLYEILAGRLPFEGGAAEICARKRMEAPPQPDAWERGPSALHHLCMRLLALDPRTRPTGEEILHAIGGIDSTDSPSPSAARSGDLWVGRQSEQQQLDAWLRDVRRGATHVALLKGVSGIGKSALAQRFLDAARQEPNTLVLSGRCYERESVPYKALDSLIDGVAAYLRRLPAGRAQEYLPRGFEHLVRVFPVLLSVRSSALPQAGGEIGDVHELRRRAFAALRELFGRLGDRCHLVMFIDDLQWGDTDSASALSELLRMPDPPRLLFLGACRSEDLTISSFMREWQAFLTQSYEAPPYSEVAIGPLDLQEATALAHQLLDGNSAASARLAAEQSGGTPMFVYELTTRGGREGSECRRQAALDEVLWQRIDALPSEHRELVAAVAIAGRPIPRSLAMEASRLDPGARCSRYAIRGFCAQSMPIGWRN